MHVFIRYVSGLISLIYGVPSVFSFPTLLARAPYMSYGGGGKSNGLVSTPCSPPPTHGMGGGVGGRGPVFGQYHL
jgi:hypothetical protein